MKLKRSAKHNLTTPIEAMTTIGVWEEWTTGRFSTVDRFLSNFHRPLQRRAMFTDPDIALPDSMVVRNKVTQEIYFIGQSRHDTDEDEAYTRLSVVHYAETGNVQPIKVTRKVVDVNRPPETIGELVDLEITQTLATFEYYKTTEVYNTEDSFLVKFYIFMPHGTDVQSEDILTTETGEQYQVEGVFNDSDFTGFYAEKKPDTTETAKYLVPVVGFGYDPATGVVNKTYDEYLFTCEVSTYKSEATVTGNTYDHEVFVKSPSLPITPKVGDKIEVSGKVLHIDRIEQNKEAAYQVRLLCSEAFR